MRGGHLSESTNWALLLKGLGFGRVAALGASAYSARAFFFLDASLDIRQRAAQRAAV
jgi:hypothetical protein